MNAKIFIAFLAALILSLAAAPGAHAESWGPWSVNSDASVLLNRADREKPASVSSPTPEASAAATPFIWLLKFYQGIISPIDGDRCPMYPTCSHYSVQAIRKHGPIIGIMMTSDRLMHEADEQHFAPLVKVGNRYRYADPVENNDFWWNNK